MEKADYRVILFYKFVKIDEPSLLMNEQRELCDSLGLLGRMLIATEGVNATFEGTSDAIDKYKTAMISDARFSDVMFKESDGTGEGFNKLKIKVRDEIVTLGAGEIDPAKRTAKEMTADELHRMFENDEDFVVLDLRNDYEIASGKFDKTIDPKLHNFRDLPERLVGLRNSEAIIGKKVVAVCTGGIRCEKATKIMDDFDNLYQLKDGIHTYMEKYPGQHFKGTLFVFDNRMVTDVVDTPNREIVGKCGYCGSPSEDYYNNDSYTPSRKIICCDSCIQQYSEQLRPVI